MAPLLPEVPGGLMGANWASILAHIVTANRIPITRPIVPRPPTEGGKEREKESMRESNDVLGRVTN